MSELMMLDIRKKAPWITPAEELRELEAAVRGKSRAARAVQARHACLADQCPLVAARRPKQATLVLRGHTASLLEHGLSSGGLTRTLPTAQRPRDCRGVGCSICGRRAGGSLHPELGSSPHSRLGSTHGHARMTCTAYCAQRASLAGLPAVSADSDLKREVLANFELTVSVYEQVREPIHGEAAGG